MRLKPSNGKRKKPGTRVRQSTCLVAVEGANKTEKNYINSYNRDHSSKYRINYVPGNNTDIPNMVEMLIEEMKDLAIDDADGDKAYLLADLDGITHGKSFLNIQKALKAGKEKGIKFVLSNPCFEIWFLLHYEYTTAPFQNGEQLIKRLKTHLKAYEKNQDVYAVLEDKTKKAVSNAKKLAKYQKEIEKDILLQNPRTNMHEFLDDIS